MSVLNYSLPKAGGFIDNLALKKRLQMLQIFLEEFPKNSFANVLDVGVTADTDALASNYFEQYFTAREKITALSNQDAKFLEELYPGLTFKKGDARQLPFDDNSMDVVFSSAVIEHIGSLQQQKQMLRECLRVARKGVFITTPNRWHPMEAHTLIPLLHWLPKSMHRRILRILGLNFYAREENLNLVDKKTLSLICNELRIKQFSIKSLSTFKIVSNLMLIIKK